MSKHSVIYLVGDAILDNFYWLSDRTRDLTKELTDLNFDVRNYAVDDVKVNDLINGVVPKEIYVKARSYQYPIRNDGKMYPIQSLLDNIGVVKSFTSVYDKFNIIPIGESSRADNMVVISMGGNDIHSNFRNIIWGPEYFVNTVITSDFINNYKKVIEAARSSCDKIVLISIYLPYLGVGSSYGLYSPLAKPIMDKWHKFINGIAKEYNIAVLDLSRTLNIGDRSHYGVDDTRASNISTKCIANCLAYIHRNYNGYHVYYAPNIDSSNIKVD
jgi:lysophospholipase L1-like esterase